MGADLTLWILREVSAATRLSKPTIYRRMASGLFPKPVHIGDNRVAWLRREIVEWVEQQVQAR